MARDGEQPDAERAGGARRVARSRPGRRHEDLLREHLQAVLEATSDLVSTGTPDGKILYFNRAAREHGGLPDDADLAGIEVRDLHPDWAFRLLDEEAIPTAIRDGIWRGETAILDREGREVPVSQVVLAHKNADGRVRYFSTIMRDISELKRLEKDLERRIEARTTELAAANASLQQEVARRSATQEELRRRNEILTTIIDNSPVIMVLADPTGRFEVISQAFERLTGWSAEGTTLADLLAVCYPDPEVRQAAEELIRTAEPGWREFPMATRDGRELRVSWANVRLSDGSEIGIGVDVTETRKAQGTLETVNAELERRTKRLQAMALELTQAQEAERRRLAQLLHDNLQQLLTGAKLRVQASRSRSASVPALAAELDLIEDLLQQAVRVSRSLTLDLAPPALYDSGLAAGLESLARQTRETHGLDVKVEVTDGAEPASEAVRVFLYQAARELLFNAAKHACATRALVSLLPCGDELSLTVEDDGIGFDPGRLAGGDEADAGFGLFSIRERITPLGGTFDVSSAPGSGTRVTLRAPLGAVVRGSTAPPSSAGRQPLIRVLLADDHPVMRRSLVALLEQQPDIEIVAEAGDGRQAVELARELVPDVAIMDVSMPEMSGLEATAILARELPSVRVVALSVYGSEDMEQRVLAAGAATYLSKDGSPAALLAAIRRSDPGQDD